MKFDLKFTIKSAVVGAMLAAAPIADMIPGVDTAAFAQNICADGKPFVSKRKSKTMSTRVYRKYEKILELNELGGEARKQADQLKKQIAELETLAASKDPKDENQAAEAQALRAQAAALKPQIAPLEAQWKANSDESENLIKDVLNSRRTQDYERASMLQFYSQIHYERGDTKSAIKVLEEMLEYGSTLKELREHQVTYNVTQLNYAEGNYDKSLEYLKKWQDMNELVCHKIRTNEDVFIAQIYFQKQDYANVLKHMYSAVESAEADPEVDVRENWYAMIASAHYNLQEMEKYRDVVEIMTVKYGKPEYYKRLAGVHSELGDEKTFYTLYEAIYEMGWMDDNATEIKTVAQIQFAQNSNIKAAWILENAMAEGRMERDIDNMRLLGQAYMASTEYEKAVAPMAFVAKETQDAQTYFDLATIELANNNMTNAVKFYDEAIRLFNKVKGKKRETAKIIRAKIGKGAALSDLKQIENACKVFQDVGRSTKSKRILRQVNQFKRSLAADIARQDMFSGKDSGRKCK